jgi:peptide-methionine (S)-S-oxide reductase
MQTETATLAGGCFWCTEAIFQKLNGVISVMPGYSGGTTENPTWESTHGGDSGHAESIQIEFDPSIISYKTLLDVFWHLHDPTTLNSQGADVGTQYRSAIFYHSDEQKKIAEESKKAADESGMYTDPIVTEITPYTNFYPADEYHRNFYQQNTQPFYCRIVIDPKIRKLMKEFPTEVKQ